MIYGILAVLGTAYMVRVMLFDMESRGPWESTTRFVRSMDMYGSALTRPVNFFDRIRRLAGAYRVTTDSSGTVFWDVRADRVLVWQCPKCLTFWLCLPTTVLLIVCTPANLLMTPVIHLGLVWCVQFLVFIQLRIE